MRLSMMWRIKQIEENVIGHYDLLDSSDTALLKNVWRSESALKWPSILTQPQLKITPVGMHSTSVLR